MVALQKNKENKEHKQKITVNITLKGIRILDETTEVFLLGNLKYCKLYYVNF